jgi:predicted transcriptional regulator
MDDEKRDEIIKYTFNKYGKYESLIKDVKLVEYFIARTDEEIRQKTIIEYFGNWSPKTVRRHLKRLVEKKIIKESQDFKGTYIFHSGYDQDMKIDMDSIARAILGEELYEQAKSCDKYKEDKRKHEEELEYQRNMRLYDRRHGYTY